MRAEKKIFSTKLCVKIYEYNFSLNNRKMGKCTSTKKKKKNQDIPSALPLLQIRGKEVGES
jgi:hypothetical protein